MLVLHELHVRADPDRGEQEVLAPEDVVLERLPRAPDPVVDPVGARQPGIDAAEFTLHVLDAEEDVGPLRQELPVAERREDVDALVLTRGIGIGALLVHVLRRGAVRLAAIARDTLRRRAVLARRPTGMAVESLQRYAGVLVVPALE